MQNPILKLGRAAADRIPDIDVCLAGTSTGECGFYRVPDLTFEFVSGVS